MIIKGRNQKAVAWVNFFSAFRKVVSYLRNQLPKPKKQTPPSKIGFKRLVLVVFVTIFLWTFFSSYMIYRNTPGKVAAVLAESIDMKVRKHKKKTKEALKAATLGPLRWMAAQFRGTDLPEVYIDIKFKHFRKLEEKRKESLRLGVLFTEEDDYVPAQIRHEGRTIKVKLRLKGDWTDHLAGEKWSFRVHVKGDDHLLGIRRFSLQDPRARGYDGEILFFEALKREGILAPRYSFVDLTINGKKMGITALEEHFSKELLESQGRREGVILKFDESLVWLAEPEIFNQRGFGGVYDNYKNATIKPFRLNRIKRSEKLVSELKVATGLLRAFVDGTLKPSQVFDPNLMGRFIAVGDFWGTWHGLRWHNLRFYYNAITGYLEPIGFDAEISYNAKPDIDPTAEPIITKILDDSIRTVYMETLERLSEEAKGGTTARWVAPLTQRNMQYLHKEFPYLDGIDLRVLTQWSEDKLNSITRRNLLYPKILQAYLVKNKMESYLELQNPLPYDVMVSSIRLTDSLKKEPINFDLRESSSLPLKVPYSEKGGLPTVKRIYFKKNDIEKGSQFVITANIKGDKKVHTVESVPYFINVTKRVVSQPTLAETLAQHPFLTVDEKEKILRVEPGQWHVESWLMVPEDFELRLSEGTTLSFSSSAGLLARGPVTLRGTKDHPVVLEGKINSKKAGHWQGIAVLKSKNPSHWTHVQIKNTKGIENNGWVVDAGVTFYESDVYLRHVTFSGNRCEDALNIVRSTFDLNEVDIKNAVSDGLDVDFSNGAVTGGNFENLGYAGGGDAIDVSGTRVIITGTQFHKIADKAISAGEESHMESTGLSIQKVGVGIASKDGSHVSVQNSQIVEAELAGLMAYTKKRVYPPAVLDAKDITFEHSTPNALVQNGNEILLDRTVVEPTDFDVKNLYKTSMKSGLK